MNALGSSGMRQSDLWKRLNVVRSVISVMVRALVKRGWVKRVRAADSRTWLVMLTQKGREIFRRAFDEKVESGDTAVAMDWGLTQMNIEADSQTAREHFLDTAMNISYSVFPPDPPGEVPYAS